MRVIVSAIAVILTTAGVARGADEQERVSRPDLVAAMRDETGYDRTATTNLPRLQARVFLRLAGKARARRPDGPPLFVDHEDWFRAYLEALRLTEERAPEPLRLSRAHEGDITIEHRPARVVRRVLGGCVPSLALSVRWAPPGAAPPGRYSYEDTRASPQLRVTVSTVVTYRLLDCDGILVYDDIEGLWGRPTTGILGALFRLIGDAKAEWSRIGLSRDGWQVVHGMGSKAFLSRTETVTIRPDGTAERGVPAGRPDLAALAGRLHRPIEIEYLP